MPRALAVPLAIEGAGQIASRQAFTLHDVFAT
jgi:hypothetical protein